MKYWIESEGRWNRKEIDKLRRDVMTLARAYIKLKEKAQ
jgi:hypothetical protein